MRPAFARIDLTALQHNYGVCRSHHGGPTLAVIKANAYGHGALRCAQALADTADGFAVALVEEALELRTGGITAPILVLEGAFAADDLAAARQHKLWLVVHHEQQLRMIEEADAGGERMHFWLKLNTGMNRAGFEPEQAHAAWKRLQASRLTASITLMTHMARADEPMVDTTLAQLQRFDAVAASLPGAHSVANSAGLLAWPDARRHWGRAGIALYGADPLPEEGHGLRPVMTLGSQIMAVRQVAAGAAIGYGARFIAPREMRIGLVAMGYADGYPRSAPDGTPVAVDGIRTRLVGRVSMDMLTVDLTPTPQATIGSVVELWGPHIPINQVAAAAGTIAYEPLCNVKRVRFDYV